MTQTMRVCVIDVFMSDQRTARGSSDWICFVAEYPACLSIPQGEINGIHIQMPEWVFLPQKASFPWAQCHPDTRAVRIPGSYTHGASITPVTNKHVFFGTVWILFNTAHLFLGHSLRNTVKQYSKLDTKTQAPLTTRSKHTIGFKTVKSTAPQVRWQWTVEELLLSRVSL